MSKEKKVRGENFLLPFCYTVLRNKKVQNFGKYIFFFIIGSFVGACVYVLIPYLPLPVSSPVFSFLGIQKPRIIGFLPYFLSYRATNKYDSFLTTLNYFGLTIGPDGHIVKLTSPQQEDPSWHDFQTAAIQNKLKHAQDNYENLSLSVVLEDEDAITLLLQNPQASAAHLLADTLPLMQKYHFTDLNVDIESFAKPDTAKMNAFTTFLQVMKNGLKKNDVTLTVAIAPIALVKPTIVNPVQVGEIADYVIVMAYDYNTVISSNTGPIAPLGGMGKEREYDVATAIYLAKKAINPQKIILGIPLYGYEWDSLSSSPGAATIPNTGQTASNRRIVQIFTKSCSICSVVQDSLAGEPDFIFKDSATDAAYHQAFVFDKNALAKRIAFAQKNHLAGVALWALGYEGNTLLAPLTSYKQTFHLL